MLDMEDKLTQIKENLEEIQSILEPLLEQIESQLLYPSSKNETDAIEEGCILDTLNNVVRDGSHLRKIIADVMKRSHNTIKSVNREKLKGFLDEDYTYDYGP